MQHRQDGPISDRVQKLVPMPSRSQRTRLGFSVPDHRQRDQVGPVEHGPEGVGDRVAEFTALRTRKSGRNTFMVQWDAKSGREKNEIEDDHDQPPILPARFTQSLPVTVSTMLDAPRVNSPEPPGSHDSPSPPGTKTDGTTSASPSHPW